MAQRDFLNTMNANERAREREEAARARRRADLERRREQAQASLYLIEEEALQEGYYFPPSGLEGVNFQIQTNVNEYADGEVHGAGNFGDVGHIGDHDTPIDLTVSRRVLRAVPIGGIAGDRNVRDIAGDRHGFTGDDRGVGAGYRGRNIGRGIAGVHGDLAAGINPGWMPADVPERSRYWRKQYFQSILGSGGDQQRNSGRRTGGGRGGRGGRSGRGGGGGQTKSNIFYVS